jgi:hypothetical protein
VTEQVCQVASLRGRMWQTKKQIESKIHRKYIKSSFDRFKKKLLTERRIECPLAFENRSQSVDLDFRKAAFLNWSFFCLLLTCFATEIGSKSAHSQVSVASVHVAVAHRTSQSATRCFTLFPHLVVDFRFAQAQNHHLEKTLNTFHLQQHVANYFPSRLDGIGKQCHRSDTSEQHCSTTNCNANS